MRETTEHTLEFERNLSDNQKAFLITPLNKLPISARARHAFPEAGIHIVGDLIEKPISGLSALQNVGRKTVKELSSIVNEYGFTIGQPVLGWSPKTVQIWKSEYGHQSRHILHVQLLRRLREFGGANGELEPLLIALARYLMGERNTLLLRKLLGWDGTEPKTLEEVGRAHDLTRERVRQIRQKFFVRIRQQDVQLPELDIALKIIQDSLPCLEQQVLEKLNKVQLIAGSIGINGIGEAARLFSLPKSYTVKDLADGNRIVIGTKHEAVLGLTLSLAHRLNSSRGCGSVESVGSLLEQQGIRGIGTNLIKPIINSARQNSGSPSEWLDDACSWFWFPKRSRNRLLNLLRKVFSVCTTVGTSELRTNIRKNIRMGWFAPPAHILQELCIQGLGCRVKGELISVAETFHYKEELGSNDQIFFEAMREHDGVMNHYALLDECMSRGMNFNTFSLMVKRSPILTNFGRHVHSIVGTSVSPGVVNELASKGTGERVLKDWGWTGNKKPWFACKATQSVIGNGLVNMPAGYEDLIQGCFIYQQNAGEVEDDVDEQTDTTEMEGHISVVSDPIEIRSQGRFVSGLRGALADVEAALGDWIVLIFDLEAREFSVRVGDESIVDDL